MCTYITTNFHIIWRTEEYAKWHHNPNPECRLFCKKKDLEFSFPQKIDFFFKGRETWSVRYLLVKGYRQEENIFYSCCIAPWIELSIGYCVNVHLCSICYIAYMSYVPFIIYIVIIIWFCIPWVYNYISICNTHIKQSSGRKCECKTDRHTEKGIKRAIKPRVYILGL